MPVDCSLGWRGSKQVSRAGAVPPPSSVPPSAAALNQSQKGSSSALPRALERVKRGATAGGGEAGSSASGVLALWVTPAPALALHRSSRPAQHRSSWAGEGRASAARAAAARTVPICGPLFYPTRAVALPSNVSARRARAAHNEQAHRRTHQPDGVTPTGGLARARAAAIHGQTWLIPRKVALRPSPRLLHHHARPGMRHSSCAMGARGENQQPGVVVRQRERRPTYRRSDGFHTLLSPSVQAWHLRAGR